MFRTFALVALALAGVATVAAAQPGSDIVPQIDIYGMADTLLPPDHVVYMLNVHAKHLNIDSVRGLHDKKMDRLLDLVKRMKIDRSDVRMDMLSIERNELFGGIGETDFNPRAFQSDEDKEEMREYFADQNVVVTMRDLSRHSEFITELMKLDIDLTRRPQFRLSNENAIRQALTVRAVRDAQRQADVVASESGMVLGDPISIGDPYWFSDVDFRYSGGDPEMAYRSAYGAMRGSYDSITPDLLKFSISVSVTFRMESR